MRIVLAAATALLAAAAPSHAQEAPAPQAQVSARELIDTFHQRLAQGDEILARLGAMHARDQYLRRIMIEGFQRDMSAETRQAYIDGTSAVFDRRDGENSDALKDILTHISWLELAALSPQAESQAFSILSHSDDIPFKEEMIAQFEPLVRAGQFEGQRYAMLVDDVRTTQGRPQLYGTNFECRDGVHQPKLTEQMETLNERRAALGMDTIEGYGEGIARGYGACPTGYSGN